MPDRFWVGGSGTWDTTSTANWSASSGGGPGASVPTSVDSVFINGLSDSGAPFTVTISGTVNCNDLTINGLDQGLTLAGTSVDINVYGSLLIQTTNVTRTMTGSNSSCWTFRATTTGKTIDFGSITTGGRLIFNGVGGEWILQRNLTTSGAGTGGFFGQTDVTNGILRTNGFTLTTFGLFSTGATTRTVDLTNSTVNLSGYSADNRFFEISGSNVTFTTTGSTINNTSVGFSFNGGGQTFNNVAFTSTSTGTNTINGLNTFNNLSFTGPASAGVTQVQFNERQIVNGTFSTSGTAGNRRIWFRSATTIYGIALPLLTVNGNSTGLADADFRDVIVTGTAAPISGTRIGDLRGNSGITFSAPKTVFRIGTGSWSDNQWAATSGGAVSPDNFPLAQDTAVLNESTSAGTHTLDGAIGYIGTIDMSARTSALTLSIGTAQTVYGNWTNGSGITISGTPALTFSGRNTQTITSAGKAFPGGGSMIIDTFGGTVQPGDPLTSSSTNFTLTNGTFDTQGHGIALGGINASGSNVRALLLRNSTVTVTVSIVISTTTNLTLDAGTSSIVTGNGFNTLTGNGLTYNDFTFAPTPAATVTMPTNLTFNNFTIQSPAGVGFADIRLGGNITVNGTLSLTGASPTRRVFLRSDTVGAARIITAGDLSAVDCDLRDITITGAAAGFSVLRGGDCGGNSGITFPAPKTVYWNLAGSQNWSATGWAPSSGGTPAINNFPLAQDTAVFNNSGAAGTITLNVGWNIGTLDSSARTTSVTFSTASSTTTSVHGDWLFGSGVTLSGVNGSITFAKRGLQYITSNGRAFDVPVVINSFSGEVILLDSFTCTSGFGGFSSTSGAFNGNGFNVTSTAYSGSGGSLKMGGGLWTLTGSGTQGVWSAAGLTSFDKSTSNIISTGGGTGTLTFSGSGQSYNKLTFAGSGSGTYSISGNNSFTELASTKTVAFTIALGSTTQEFGAWTVTGTVGNVVTLTGTGTSHTIAGAATSGIDYLAMGSIGFAASSPGEFYAGPNSTGTAAAPVFRTAPPTSRTLYWVGGTGNWGDTARWSTSSGGGGGAALPTSLDNVIFNSASNATAYTATLNVVARCNQLTIAGPASGNLTLASSATTNFLILHGNTVFPATGFTRTFSSAMVLSGSTTGKTFTSNGVAFQGLGSGAMIVNGVGAGWSMSDPLNLSNNDFLNLINGTFSTNNHGLTVAILRADTGGSKTLNLGSSIVTMTGSSSPIQFGSGGTVRNLFTFNPGTSQINITVINASISTNDIAFHNVSFSSAPLTTFTINGSSTFNNLSFGAPGSSGLQNIVINGNLTVSGTLTFTAGVDATRRHFCRTTAIGTTQTITCAAFSGTDVDFRDIAVTGVAAPISGTRLGDCKGNSGITFPAGTTKYWNLAAGGSWSATAWTTVFDGANLGTPAVNDFPLAQDTCVILNTGLNNFGLVTINAAFNIGNVNMSSRTNIMTLSTGGSPAIYGNWVNGTGVSFSGTNTLTFAGRTLQSITSAGRSFTQPVTFDSPGGTVRLLDALNNDSVNGINLTQGTFDMNNFNASVRAIQSNSGLARTLAIGSGILTITGAPSPASFSVDGMTVTGSGTISLTAAASKTFAGGGINYANNTLNQGGAGTFTITGNNTFRDITATQTATSAATINLGTTTQRVTQFRGKGEAARLLTIQGTSAANPATLIYTGSGTATDNTVDYLSILGVRAYPLTNTWYAGTNSVNSGMLGWDFTASPSPPAQGAGGFFMIL